MVKTASIIAILMLAAIMLVGCRGDSPATQERGTATAETFTDDEAALIDLLLSTNDLAGEWIEPLLRVPDVATLWSLCDTPAFPRADERLAGIDAEYRSIDGTAIVRQGITRLPEPIASEAMAFVRERTTCTGWTEESGTRYDVARAEAPALGDDSHAIHIIRTDADGQSAEGDIVFIRFGEYVTTITTMTEQVYAPAFTHEIAQRAAAILDASVGTTNADPEFEAALMLELLTLDDLGDSWEMPQAAHRSEIERWTGLCNSEPFERSDRARGRVGVEFYEGNTAESTSLSQVLIAYPESVSTAAFAHEVDAASCSTFRSGTSTVNVSIDDQFPAIGHESFAARFSFTTNDREVDGYWIVVRVGERLTTLIYTDPTNLSTDDAIEVAELAAARLGTTGP